MANGDLRRTRLTLPVLKAKIRAKEIDTVLVVFPDVFGRLVGKRVTGNYFAESVAGHGTHACNYLLTVNIEMDPLDGFKLASWEKGFGDFELRPDFSTLRILPWHTSTALVLCDVHHHGGAPVEEAPRAVLQRQVKNLASRHWQCKIASELEFYLFNDTYHAAFAGHYQNLTPSSDYRIDYHTLQPTRDENIMRSLRNLMDAADVPVESSKGEWGRGQHEINFVYDEPVRMGDMHHIFKHGSREIAQQNGKALTFMPKFSATEAGSSCHIHLSLWQGRRNLFWDAQKRSGSRFFRQFLGGLMKYSPELCCFFAPTVNSYKRYQSGSWAPTKMAWATDNRTAGFRVVGEANSFRLENRMPGADANPYLAFAAMIAAGLAGMDENLDCGKAYEGNAYVDAELVSLPKNLREATDALEQSELARKSFGGSVVDFYVRHARCEIEAFDNAVTDWERIRYFERI